MVTSETVCGILAGLVSLAKVMSIANDVAAPEENCAQQRFDLRIAVMRLARRLRTERASDTLTPSQLAVLATLVREGRCARATWPPPSGCSRRR